MVSPRTNLWRLRWFRQSKYRQRPTLPDSSRTFPHDQQRPILASGTLPTRRRAPTTRGIGLAGLLQPRCRWMATYRYSAMRITKDRISIRKMTRYPQNGTTGLLYRTIMFSLSAEDKNRDIQSVWTAGMACYVSQVVVANTAMVS